MQTYLTHGFQIKSSWPLPAGVQFCTEYAGVSRLFVQPGVIPWPQSEEPSGEAFHLTDDGHFFYWSIMGTVRMHPSGDAIVDVLPGAPEGIVPHAILGPLAAHFILLSGDVALHANCVATDDGLLAVVGPSGAGKSSLAAALIARGAIPHCDDVTSITQHTALVPFGTARVKLNPDVLAELPLAPASISPVYAGIEKRSAEFALPADTSTRPLKAIYRLCDAPQGSPPELEEIRGFPMAIAVMHEVYRPHIAVEAFGFEEILRRCSSLVGRVRFFDIRRERDLTKIDSLAEVVLKHFQSLG